MLNIFGNISNISYLYGMEKRLHKESGLEVCSNGDVYGKQGLRKKSVGKNGYVQYSVRLKGNKSTVFTGHRLVAECWLDNIDNLPLVQHKNDIKTDNRVENLKWSTYSDNTKQAMENGKHHKSIVDGELQYKLTDKDIEAIFYLFSIGTKKYKIAEQFNVSPSYISKILYGQRRK